MTGTTIHPVLDDKNALQHPHGPGAMEKINAFKEGQVCLNVECFSLISLDAYY